MPDPLSPVHSDRLSEIARGLAQVEWLREEREKSAKLARRLAELKPEDCGYHTAMAECLEADAKGLAALVVRLEALQRWNESVSATLEAVNNERLALAKGLTANRETFEGRKARSEAIRIANLTLVESDSADGVRHD